jgi:formate dehydrogenase subunit delta
MNIQQLVKMANQIGQFFQSEPDQTEAVQSIAAHLKRFWEPGMRKAIAAHVKAGGEGLLPIVITAVQENNKTLV